MKEYEIYFYCDLEDHEFGYDEVAYGVYAQDENLAIYYGYECLNDEQGSNTKFWKFKQLNIV